MLDKIKNIMKSKWIKQILRFGVVGGIAFLIDSSLLYILTEYVHLYVLVSSVISFTVSLVFNYILSILWVFDVKKKQTFKEISIFVLLSIIGLGLNQIIMYFGIEVFHVYYMVCKILATFIVMAYNFITRKIFIER